MTPTLEFGASERNAAATLVELALAEDLGGAGDLTSHALLTDLQRGSVHIVARQPGILAGLPIAEMVFDTLDPQVQFYMHLRDGARFDSGALVASLSGPLRSLLIGERTALNILSHLSGIATTTRKYVDAVRESDAVVLDTRKTLPGWRVLQKYAVRAGGGTNHRMGLYDGVLIKDNHLAAWSDAGATRSIAQAVRQARSAVPAGTPIEVEVDTLEQLADAIQGNPDIVLLDNMTPDQLRQAVQIRNEQSPHILLEASGGVTYEKMAAIAASGVDRISVGALTHSVTVLDLAFDWQPPD